MRKPGWISKKKEKSPCLFPAAHVSASTQSSGKFNNAPGYGLHNTRKRCPELSWQFAWRYQVWILWWAGTGEFACSPEVWVGSVSAVVVAISLWFILQYDELPSPCTPPLACMRLRWVPTTTWGEKQEKNKNPGNFWRACFHHASKFHKILSDEAMTTSSRLSCVGHFDLSAQEKWGYGWPNETKWHITKW